MKTPNNLKDDSIECGCETTNMTTYKIPYMFKIFQKTMKEVSTSIYCSEI